MSDQIKHECGIVVLRLLKPLEYYKEKYGTWKYGINKLYLLIEKQHNRGQDGAGALCLKFDTPPGIKYMHRKRSTSSTPILDIFKDIYTNIDNTLQNYSDKQSDFKWIKENIDFAGELFLGHLRYGTFGKNNVEYVHPVLRLSNWKTKTLALVGNFNLTNVDELFKFLVDFGQNPKEFSDTVTALELIGLFMDEEVQKLFREYKNQGFSNYEISGLIAENIDIFKILKQSTSNWDGGYVMGGAIGHGDSFIVRDPWGIRPAYYYYDDEIFVAASERPAIQTALNVKIDEVKELEPGFGIIVKKNGNIIKQLVRVPEERSACSFERIYFSRGTDYEIYEERKKLGELLVSKIIEAINEDFENTVFSYIPNTSETAFYGMLKGLETFLNNEKIKIMRKRCAKMSEEEMHQILEMRPRVEKIAVKDVKMRTFITQDEDRNEMVEHVYDITYGTIRPEKDTLVVIDDSIVRGTTLKKSILRMLDRLNPKKIIIVSSAPQIRYPDCYGIDMTKIGDFIAFNAAIALLKETKNENIIHETYQMCKFQQNLPKEDIVNYVTNIYKPFSEDEISNKISQLIKNSIIRADIQVIFQSVENLHLACPNNKGDWYFTGNYPTPGGNKVVNTSFINYYENKNERAY